MDWARWPKIDLLSIYRYYLLILMDSPRSNTLKHLEKSGLVKRVQKSTITQSTSLDFTQHSEVPNAQDQPILVILNNNNIYYGKIVNRKAEDKEAIFIYVDGSFYQGSCKAGKFEGKGKLIKFGEDFKGKIFSYDGQWHNSKPHGFGREEIYKSMVYEGQFVEGKKSGKGFMQYVDGSRYQGEFYNNQVQGQGVYKTKAHQWRGNWKQGYLQGEGQQISFGQFIQNQSQQQIAGGESVYNGGFLRGLKHGKGTYKWGKNFSQYEGTFDNGQLDGEGRFKIGDLQYTGKWKKGVQLALQSKIQLKKVTRNSTINPSLKIDIP